MWKAVICALVALLLCSCSPAPRLYRHGVASVQKGDLDRAIQDFTRAIELKPDFVGAYTRRGVAYRKKGDLDHAIQDFTAAIRLKPDLPEAHTLRGYAYTEKGDLDRAIRDFTRAIALKPGIPEAYGRRGNAYGKKGDLDRAIQDFTRAIELKPDLSETYSSRGEAYTKKGDWQRALADLTKAMDANPDRPQLANNIAWLLATCPEDHVRDGNKAMPYARKACELTNWRTANCMDTLAAACAEAGQYAEAVKWQKKAMEAPDYLKKYDEETRSRLTLYETGKPYRQTVPSHTSSDTPDVPAE